MPVPLRVLLVGESEDGFATLLAELRRAGYAPECARATSASGLEEALAQGEWQVALADVGQGEFDARKVHVLLAECERDVPLIAVAGAADEKRAQALMRA